MLLINTLKQQLSAEPLLSTTNIVVAYSGGVDSHVLLHALHSIQHSVQQDEQYNFQLSAIHIHHGLSQHANQWQIHCQQVCKQLNVAFQTANVSVKALPRKSLEAQARDARYSKLVELAPANGQILLGQHQDDQLETFILQLKRGAGPKGLSAMNRSWFSQSPSQSSSQKHLPAGKQVGFYRPLLDIPQQAILDYAQLHNLQWCEDESNQDTTFERNFLRHDVLPVLQNRWPEIARTVARSASLCAEQQSLLDEICQEKLKAIKISANSLHLPALKQLSQSWLNQLVRYWLSELHIKSPSLALLNQLRPEMLEAAADATPILQWQGWQFRRFNQGLYVIVAKPLIEAQILIWQGEAEIVLPADMGVLRFDNCAQADSDLPTFDPKAGDIKLQFGGYSQRFTPKGGKHSKPLKQWFKQWGIPPWVRNQALLLKQNDLLLGLLIQGMWHPAEDYIPASDKAVVIEFSPSSKGSKG